MLIIATTQRYLANQDYPTNIGIVRGTVSVATIVVVSAGVEIWLL